MMCSVLQVATVVCSEVGVWVRLTLRGTTVVAHVARVPPLSKSQRLCRPFPVANHLDHQAYQAMGGNFLPELVFR